MTEQTAAEAREAELAKVFRRMGRAARRGDMARFEELKAQHDRLKAAHVARSHEEQREEARARRVAVRAAEAQEEPVRWRLPVGFSSPLAEQRARQARPAPVPQVPTGGHLSPWRGGSLASERIWRP